MTQAISRPELEADLARATTRVFSVYFGRGPASAQAQVSEDFVFVATEGVLTRAEHALIAAGEDGVVRRLRFGFEDVMTNEFVSAVEAIVGRRVVAYHSQIFLERDGALELFVLDPTQPGLAPGAAPDSDAGDGGPGEAGDADRLPAPGATGAARPAMPRPVDRGILSGRARDGLGRDLVQLLQRVVGRGAARVRVFDDAGYIVCALDKALLPHEQVLLDGQRGDLVREARQTLLEQCTADIRSILERHTDRTLVEARVQVVRDPDVVFLVLDTGRGAP